MFLTCLELTTEQILRGKQLAQNLRCLQRETEFDTYLEQCHWTPALMEKMNNARSDRKTQWKEGNSKK